MVSQKAGGTTSWFLSFYLLLRVCPHKAMAAAALSFASLPGANPVLAKAKAPAISCRGAGVEKARKVNYYRVLSLESEKASAQEIKKAYRSLARRLHPDVCPPERKEESARALVEVNRAYEALSDPVLRRDHDAELGAGRGAGRAGMGRETWERQLSELARRSSLRMRQRGSSGVVTVAW